MDILAALHDTTPERGKARCKLQTILDEIAEDVAGRAELLAAVDDGARYPAQRLTLTFTALGRPVHRDLISDHRAKRCRCYR